MHDELRQLYQQVGAPGYKELQKQAELAGHQLPKQTITSLLRGTGKPRWRTLEAFVMACYGYARADRLKMSPDTFALSAWRDRYNIAYPDSRPTPRSVTPVLQLSGTPTWRDCGSATGGWIWGS